MKRPNLSIDADAQHRPLPSVAPVGRRSTPTLALMNSAIELHDSDIRELRRSGSELRVVFDPAYVHRSSGRPGTDPGEGFLQAGELVFVGGRATERGGACLGTLSDGFVAGRELKHSNVMPLPLALDGPVSAEFTFVSGAVLTVTGTSVCWIATGEARCLEAYEG